MVARDAFRVRIDTGLDSAHACTRTHALTLLGKMRLRAPQALPRNNLRREIHDNRDYPREFRMQVSPRSHDVCLRAPCLHRSLSSSMLFIPFHPACVRIHFSVPTNVFIISITFTLLLYFLLCSELGSNALLIMPLLFSLLFFITIVTFFYL